MSDLFKWTTSETEKFLGTKSPKKDKDGQPVLNADGTAKMERDTQTVSYDHPVLSTVQCTSVEDIALVLSEVLAEARTGFDSLRTVIEHINYGFHKDPARMFNQGNDIRYSASQQEAIKLYRNLAKKGHIPMEDAVRLLSLQGIEDAEKALSVE